ncbi:MAG: cysteine--tRNA ligase [Actinomycetota bacterium]|nr:cysteine--tRNA ligase [Actinomycetota bacterium]
MGVVLYNTLTRTKEPLEPIEPPRVRLFVCGPTVYDLSHLGHAKTYTQFDLVARHLRHRGFDVLYVQNVTDIDDRIIDRANERGVDARELAKEFTRYYREDMEALGNTSVDELAPATDFMDQIVSQVKRLVDGGHAYELPDGWYFDVESFPEYGKLARRTEVAHEDSVARVDENPLKKDPRDFALWKKRKEGEPYWTTELGEGRPGWHIEDTAITESLLGPQYEIHGGAVDLIFPHHEAEIAQMESISGRAPLARYWMHTGFLTLRKDKMSKSTGNFFTIRDVLGEVDARVLRFFFLSHHYRSRVDYDPDMLEDAAASLRRIENFWLRLPADDTAEPEGAVAEARDAMLARLDDDFDAPGALAVLYEFIREQNRAERPAAGSRRLLEEFDAVFAVLPPAAAEEEHDDEWITGEVERRQRLRAERKFAEADEIRDRLREMNVVIEDTADGVRWHREVPA